jgi:hypothetical protein
VTVSRITTVWCDGLDDGGIEHAAGCPYWQGEGRDVREARRASSFEQQGRFDYSRQCLAERAARAKAEVGG